MTMAATPKRISDDPLLTAGELATWLNTNAHALAQLRYRHEGPAFIHLGRSIRYLRSDVEDYLLRSRELAA